MAFESGDQVSVMELRREGSGNVGDRRIQIEKSFTKIRSTYIVPLPRPISFPMTCVAARWSRTLSMAKALCGLQLELQLPLSNDSLANVANETIFGCQTPLEGKGFSSCTKIGNFPSPRELATRNEELLANRCHLGYRAGRILKLAREIVEGRIRLRELEDVVGTLSLSEYNKLAERS
ncbi:DNA glycosylase [Olea europaea subsp. europaea]|uniref:DNA glycosylase n=1 Tax=Olea europaea subsp. europaea TaxID=158383 RepID=A0A8S0RKL2_OLEEU|nr:DNA glycosylase [Olea europaea subsp. europaea]